MATLTAGELTNLRETKHSSKFYLSVLQPTTLLTARVNDAGIARGDRSIAYDTGSSSNFSAIEAGQTLWVGTTAGDNDVGRIRIKSITGTAASGTITVDENGLDWGDDLHLTILLNYEIWPIPPRIDSGIFYKFYDTTYSNQNSQPNPVTIAGPHQAGFLASGSLILNVRIGDSYTTAQSATISSRSVTVEPSAGVTVGSYSAPNIPVTYTAAGTYWVKASTTDSNGKTQDTYRIHFVYDASNLPYNDFSITGLSGDWQSGGWSFDVEVYGDAQLSDFPDGSICVVWRKGQINDAETYVNVWELGDNIIGAGYIRRDSDTDSLQAGDAIIRFSVDTPDGLMSNRTEMGPVSLETATSPGTWYQYATWLTTGRAIHHLLKWHSTVLETCDIYGLLDNTLGVQVAEFSENSLLGRVNGFAFRRGIFAKMVSDRSGRLHLAEDLQMFNETNRDAEDTVFSLTRNDVGGQIDIVHEGEKDTALAFLDGFSFNGTTATALVSIAGGYVDGGGTSIQVPEPQGSGSANVTRQVLNNQTDSNEKCGRLLAAANNPFKEIRLPLRGDYLGAFDIVPSLGWYGWSIADNVLKRQLPLNSKKFLCRRAQSQIDVSAGTIETDVVLEMEAEGPDGIPGNYPTSYPAVTLPEPNWTLPTASSATYGYFAGGGTGSNSQVVTADRITFASGMTAANTDSDLSQARQWVAGLSDAATYGYFAGGSTNTAANADVVTADRITFSTGVTAANATSDLSASRYAPAALSDGTTYGYWAGGITDDAATEVATADRITFSTGATAANTDSDLSITRALLAGVSDGTTYGYFAGGIRNNGVTVVLTADRITFSTGVTAGNIASNLSGVRGELAALSDGTTYGYFAGGRTALTASDRVTTADRITFSTGATAANTDSDLSQARWDLSASSDGATYGYFAGGTLDGSAGLATADRITFATGVTAANTDSNLSQARHALAGLSDANV